MKIAVIGFRGFIGQAMTRAIARTGNISVGIDREQIIFEDCSIVVDCNGNSKKFQANQNPENGYKEIVQSVDSRLNQIVTTQRYVYISSGEVYGEEQFGSSETDPIDLGNLSNYGKFKFLAEELVRDKITKSLIIRPSGFVGAGLKKNPIYDLLSSGQLFVHPDSRFQFCDVDWFADTVLKLALTIQEGTINVSALGTVSVAEIATRFNLEISSITSDAKIEQHELDTDQLSAKVKVPDTTNVVYGYVQGSIGNNVRA